MAPEPLPLHRRTPLVTWIIVVVAALYFARDFLIPLALAILISFLLTPLVKRLESWGLGNVPAVLTSVFLSLVVVATVGYIVTGQVLDLANNIQGYRSNIEKKIMALKNSGRGPVSEATRTLRELTEELNAPSEGEQSDTAPSANAKSPPKKRPIPVEVIDPPGNAFALLRNFVSQLIGPLGTAAIVAVFVIFLLIQREDLRDRIIHLIGPGHLHATTQAFNEASHRVSRYLVAQLIVNVTYGIPIGVGLYFIGIPNAILWGLLATVLRFVPYIGPWVAAFFPVALSMAVSDSWREPALTLGLFITIELLSNNLVEPWLYGASTGLSPIAIILAAVFWTWLWGTIGLLLATPLTVCISVLGRYIPGLAFLDVLLGSKSEMAAPERFYQRLLAGDEEGATQLAEEWTSNSSLIETYDQMIVPALALAETDNHRDVFDEKQSSFIYDTTREVIATLRDQYAAARKLPVAAGETPEGTPTSEDALFLPAKDEADELVGHILAQLLWAEGCNAHVISAKALAGEMMEQIAELRPCLIFISALPPGATLPASYLCKRVRARFPQARIVVGLWTGTADSTRSQERLRQSSADNVVANLPEAFAYILPLAKCTPDGNGAAKVTAPAPQAAQA